VAFSFHLHLILIGTGKAFGREEKTSSSHPQLAISTKGGEGGREAFARHHSSVVERNNGRQNCPTRRKRVDRVFLLSRKGGERSLSIAPGERVAERRGKQTEKRSSRSLFKEGSLRIFG